MSGSPTNLVEGIHAHIRNCSSWEKWGGGELCDKLRGGCTPYKIGGGGGWAAYAMI